MIDRPIYSFLSILAGFLLVLFRLRCFFGDGDEKTLRKFDKWN